MCLKCNAVAGAAASVRIRKAVAMAMASAMTLCVLADSPVVVRRDSLTHSRLAFELSGKGTVAFIGGSITEMDGWRVKVMDDLRRRFPNTEFNFICAGISSTCSDTGAYRLEEDVLSKGIPDLFFVEYAVNDSGDGYYLAGRHDPSTYAEHSLRGLEGIVRHLRKAAPNADMVMTFFTTADQLAEVRAGRIPATYAIDTKVAEHYGITTVNIAQSIVNGEEAGDFSWELYGGDCHPHEAGCARIADEYAKLFDFEWSGEPWPCREDRLPERPLDESCYADGRFLSPWAVDRAGDWEIGEVDWSQVAGENRANYREGEILTSSRPGSELSFEFTGTAVGAWVLAGPDCGSLEVSVDGGEFATYMMFSPYSAGPNGLHYPFVETFADGLEPARHRVVIRTGPAKDPASTGNAARIYRLCINAEGEKGYAGAGLKDAAKGRFLIGTTLTERQVRSPSAAELKAILGTFNAIEPENLLKPELLFDGNRQYRFDAADAYVEFGERHDLAVYGHCLVWHWQTPKWMTTGDDGRPLPRETAIENMRSHIMTVVGRYKGRIRGWDVVNEAWMEDGTMREKDSPWYQAIGPDYIELAFRFAHEADPDAELYYNDYSMAERRKADAILAMVKDFRERGIRIDAVGLQTHVSFWYPDVADYRRTMDAFAAAGIMMNVTEMDVGVLPDAEGDDLKNLYPADELPPAVQEKLSKWYLDYFRVFVDHAEWLNRVSVWGLDDGQSWLNYFPIRGRINHPLFFDRSLKPKRCLYELVKFLHLPH